jgi:hypothetical protein
MSEERPTYSREVHYMLHVKAFHYTDPLVIPAGLNELREAQGQSPVILRTRSTVTNHPLKRPYIEWYVSGDYSEEAKPGCWILVDLDDPYEKPWTLTDDQFRKQFQREGEKR